MDLGAFSISLAVKDLAASTAFYEKLATLTKRLYYVQQDGLNGPWVAVYRL